MGAFFGSADCKGLSCLRVWDGYRGGQAASVVLGGQRVNLGKPRWPRQTIGNGSIRVPNSKVFCREWRNFGVERSFEEGGRRL